MQITPKLLSLTEFKFKYCSQRVYGTPKSCFTKIDRSPPYYIKIEINAVGVNAVVYLMFDEWNGVFRLEPNRVPP